MDNFCTQKILLSFFWTSLTMNQIQEHSVFIEKMLYICISNVSNLRGMAGWKVATLFDVITALNYEILCYTILFHDLYIAHQISTTNINYCHMTFLISVYSLLMFKTT